jgi:hypothetical protein
LNKAKEEPPSREDKASAKHMASLEMRHENMLLTLNKLNDENERLTALLASTKEEPPSRPAEPQVVECPTCKSQDVNCSDPWHIDHSPAQQPEVVLSPLDRSRMVEAVTQMPEDDELAQQPEAGVDDGLPFMCNMSCCGRDDGIIVFSTWEEAEKFRESYTSGVAVAEHGYSAGPHESGHKRAVVITQAQWDGPLGIWRPRAAIASPAPGAPAAQKWWRYRCDVEQCGFERTSRNYFKVYGTCHACGVGAMRVVEEGEA